MSALLVKALRCRKDLSSPYLPVWRRSPMTSSLPILSKKLSNPVPSCLRNIFAGYQKWCQIRNWWFHWLSIHPFWVRRCWGFQRWNCLHFLKKVPDLSWKESRQGNLTRRWMFLIPTKSLRVWNSVRLLCYMIFFIFYDPQSFIIFQIQLQELLLDSLNSWI